MLSPPSQAQADAAGVDVAYSMASHSGFDYSKPYVGAISEPASAQLTLFGLAGLLGLLALWARRIRPESVTGAAGNSTAPG